MKEIDPQKTDRALAFDLWMNAPMPMMTLIKRLNVSRLYRISRQKGVRFNALMCYCICRAASQVKEFYLLPIGDKLIQYDQLAVCTIVKNKWGRISNCDLPYMNDFSQFYESYLDLTGKVVESGEDYSLSDSMIIGTSAMVATELEGVTGMYTAIYNNPFLYWGKYTRTFFHTYLTVSFQFHHTQMDGEQATHFLNILHDTIRRFKF